MSTSEHNEPMLSLFIATSSTLRWCALRFGFDAPDHVYCVDTINMCLVLVSPFIGPGTAGIPFPYTVSRKVRQAVGRVHNVRPVCDGSSSRSTPLPVKLKLPRGGTTWVSIHGTGRTMSGTRPELSGKFRG